MFFYFVLIIFFRLSSLFDFFESEIILGVKKALWDLHLSYLYMFAFCFVFSLRNKTTQGEG